MSLDISRRVIIDLSFDEWVRAMILLFHPSHYTKIPSPDYLDDKYGPCWIPHKKGTTTKVFGTGYLSSRLSYYLTHRQDPGAWLVCHACDNRKCINPKHLFLGNHQDNMNDKFNKKRQAHLRGTDNGEAKLTERDVIKIRKNYCRGSALALGKTYGVHRQTIYDIVHHRSWTHI